jgi:hypothetical protein
MSEPKQSTGQNFWKEHSESWKASGLTQQAYCAQEEISYKSFVYQHNRGHSKLKNSPVHFIEAKVKSATEYQCSSGMQVVLPNGIRIGIEGEVTAALIQTVFGIAGSIKC